MGLSVLSQFDTANTIAGTIQQSAVGGVTLNPLYSSPLTGFFTGGATPYMQPPMLNSFGLSSGLPTSYGLGTSSLGVQISPFTGTPTVLSSLGFLGPSMSFDPNTLNMAGATPTLTPEMLAFLNSYNSAPPSSPLGAPPPAPAPAAPSAAKPPTRTNEARPNTRSQGKGFLSNLGSTIGNTISTIGETVGNAVGNKIGNTMIGNTISDIGNNVGNFVSSVFNGMGRGK